MVEILFKIDNSTEGLIEFYDDYERIGHIFLDGMPFNAYIEISQDGTVKTVGLSQFFDHDMHLQCETIVVYQYHDIVSRPFKIRAVFDADTIKVYCDYENKYLLELGYIP